MNPNKECPSVKNKNFQQYPTTGLLHNNLNKSSEELIKILESYIESEDLLYYYIVDTLDYIEGQILQKGSAPNFQGGIISLCTCKHWMRTFSNIRNNENVWILGLTGKNLIKKNGGNYLYYLMKVEKKYESHLNAWQNLPEKVKKSKNSAETKFGDIFEPKNNLIEKFDPLSYKSPSKEHPHNRKDKKQNYVWYKDVKQYYNKPFVLLFGDPRYSFIWTKSRIIWSSNSSLTQGQGKITLREFLNKLKLCYSC